MANTYPVTPASASEFDGVFDLSAETTSQKINGGGGDDLIIGGSADDRVNAGGGDDTVMGGAGDDILFGNGGTDTALYQGSVIDYLWQAAKGGVLKVTDLNKADGDEGTDTLKHFEILQFNDYVLNIEGSNAAHVVAGQQTAHEDGALLFGVKAYDFDGGTPAIQALSVSGGTIEMVEETSAATGMGVGKTFGLRFEPGSAYQHLGLGETTTETVTMVVSDGQGNLTTKTFDIVIEGRNDGPVATGVTYEDVTLQEDADLAASGKVEAHDIDLNDILEFTVVEGDAAHYGELTLDAATGQWSYELDNSHPAVQALGVDGRLIEEIQVRVSDGKGGSDTITINLDIQGTNDAPVIIDQTYTNAHLREDEVSIASGRIIASDVDAGDVLTFSLVGETQGKYGSISIDAATGEWVYTLANDGDAVQSLALNQTDLETPFTIEISDGKGGTIQTTVSLTVTGSNDAPVVADVSAEIHSVQEDVVTSITGLISATDADALDHLTYSVDGAGTYGRLEVNAHTGEWTYVLDNDSDAVQALGEDQVEIESFTVTVDDGQGGQTTTQVNVQVAGTADNRAPVITSAPQSASLTAVPVAEEQSAPQPIVFQVEQFLGFQSNNLDVLRNYVAQNAADYTVETSVIDYTDDPAGFAGELPGSSPWPAAQAQGATSPHGGVNDVFFARITTEFTVTEADTYTFRTFNDDGVFLMIDGQRIITDTGYHPEHAFEGSIALAPGQHSLELFFFENGGEASLELSVRGSNGAFGLVGGNGGGLGGKALALAEEGVITFEDADLGDSHTVSFEMTSLQADGIQLDAATVEMISKGFSLGSVSDGTIDWTYAIENGALSGFSAGETVTAVFSVTVLDQDGALATSDVTVNLVGAEQQAPLVLTFDDLPGSIVPIPEGYGGFSWVKDTYYVDSTDFQGNTNYPGIAAGVTSGVNVAFDGYADEFVFTRDTDFDFESVNMTAAADSQQDVTIHGWNDGVIIGTQTVAVNNQGPTAIKLDDAIFNAVDKVAITSLGNVIVMDDMTFYV